MKVTVTAKDIQDGVRMDGDRCPAALALRRATSHDWEVAENSCVDNSVDFRYPTPAELRQFIRDFDAGRTVRPFTFQLAG